MRSCHFHECTKQIFKLSTWPPVWQYHGNQMLRKGSIYSSAVHPMIYLESDVMWYNITCMAHWVSTVCSMSLRNVKFQLARSGFSWLVRVSAGSFGFQLARSGFSWLTSLFSSTSCGTFIHWWDHSCTISYCMYSCLPHICGKIVHLYTYNFTINSRKYGLPFCTRLWGKSGEGAFA